MCTAIPQAKLPLKVVVVGAGIGGLALACSLGLRGHDVLIVEAAAELAEVGAGIYLTPNMAKLLDRWGISFRDKATPMKALTVRRWKDGTILNPGNYDDSHGSTFATHRADLHSALADKALSLENVKLRVNAPVIDVQFDRPAVVLSDGTVIGADVVLGADGIKSVVREKLLDDSSVKAYPTGDAAYRILIPRNKMMPNPELKELMEPPHATRWVGPSRHIVGYPIRNGELYNVALIHPDRGSAEESWTTRGSKQAMIDDYAEWEERITQMLSHVEENEVLEWRLNLYMPLKTWTRASVALLGDACHPMLPYVAQGAAQAVEDAGALGVIISSVSSREQIPQALQAYQHSRKLRAEKVQQSALQNRDSLHLPDGLEQEARDEMFRLAEKGLENPDAFHHKETQKALWGHDPEEAALEAWKSALAIH